MPTYSIDSRDERASKEPFFLDVVVFQNHFIDPPPPPPKDDNHGGAVGDCVGFHVLLRRTIDPLPLTN